MCDDAREPGGPNAKVPKLRSMTPKSCFALGRRRGTGRVGHHALAKVVLEEVDVLVDDIEPELGQVGTRRAVTVEGFPEGEVARDVGAHVLPRGEGGHVVVVFYHKYYKRKFRAVMVRRVIRP